MDIYAVLDKLPKIETHEHAPISACSEIVGCMANAPELQHTGSKAFYSALTDSAACIDRINTDRRYRLCGTPREAMAFPVCREGRA
jgi:hypothetical protein